MPSEEELPPRSRKPAPSSGLRGEEGPSPACLAAGPGSLTAAGVGGARGLHTGPLSKQPPPQSMRSRWAFASSHTSDQGLLEPPGASAFRFVSREKLRRKEGAGSGFQGVRGVDTRLIQFSPTLQGKAAQPELTSLLLAGAAMAWIRRLQALRTSRQREFEACSVCC